MYAVITRYGRKHLLVATFPVPADAHQTCHNLKKSRTPHLLYTSHNVACGVFRDCDGDEVKIDNLFNDK